jgi:hypothetical protein
LTIERLHAESADGTKYIVVKTTRRVPGSDEFEGPSYRLGDGQHLEPTAEPKQFRSVRPGGVVVTLID